MKSTFVSLFAALTFLGSSLTFCADRPNMHNSPKRSATNRTYSVPPTPERKALTNSAAKLRSPSPVLGLWKQGAAQKNQPIPTVSSKTPSTPGQQQSPRPSTPQQQQSLLDRLNLFEKELRGLEQEVEQLQKNARNYNPKRLNDLVNKLSKDALDLHQAEGADRNQMNEKVKRLSSVFTAMDKITSEAMIKENITALEEIRKNFSSLLQEVKQSPQSTDKLNKMLRAYKHISTELASRTGNKNYPCEKWGGNENDLLDSNKGLQKQISYELKALQEKLKQKASAKPPVPHFAPAVPAESHIPATPVAPVLTVAEAARIGKAIAPDQGAPAVAKSEPLPDQRTIQQAAPQVQIPSISDAFRGTSSNQINVTSAGSFIGSPVRPTVQQHLARVLPMTPVSDTELKNSKEPKVDEAKKASWFSLLRTAAKKHWKKATVGTLALLALAGGEVKYKLLTKLGTRLFHGASLTAPATHAVAIAAQPQASWLTRNFGWITQLFFKGA